MSEMIERVAKAICANSVSGFCLNVGGDLGCRNGRGVSPHGANCVATRIQLDLSGHTEAAEAAIRAVADSFADPVVHQAIFQALGGVT